MLKQKMACWNFMAQETWYKIGWELRIRSHFHLFWGKKPWLNDRHAFIPQTGAIGAAFYSPHNIITTGKKDREEAEASHLC